ncbi:MAG: hypothetical protein GTN85_21595, partial [Pseudomonas stutzeri]|nr:hypothetical protein [Stutzerimonas stutzeri]
VETVLGDYLQAVCVADIAPVAETIASLAEGNLTLFSDERGTGSPKDRPDTLASKVTGAPEAVERMLSAVRIATSLGAALSMAESLGEGASVVTEDGIWLGKNWLRVARTKDGRAGVLAREHDMRRKRADIREMQARFESARKLQRDGRARLTQLEERRETLQRDAASLLNEYSEIKAALESARYKVDQAAARALALADEANELDSEKISAEEQLRESRRIHGQAVESMERLNTEKASLEAQREKLLSELGRVRAQAEEDRLTVQNIAIQFESRRTSKESAAQNLARMQAQLT